MRTIDSAELGEKVGSEGYEQVRQCDIAPRRCDVMALPIDTGLRDSTEASYLLLVHLLLLVCNESINFKLEINIFLSKRTT